MTRCGPVALDKLRNGDAPTPGELAALEIVIRLLRPVVFSRGGALDDLPDTEGHNLYPEDLKDMWNAFRDKVKPVLGSIGRIQTAPGTHVGTGFLIAPGLLATNRHVLGALTFGSEVLGKGVAKVTFKRETGLNDSPGDIVAIDGALAPHPSLDMALFRLPSQDRPLLELDMTPPADDMRVAVIGYPGEDKENNPLFLAGVFNGKFGVKRAALGEVLDGMAAPQFFHDCSTTRGNSGSPVLSLDSGKAVGIHRAGFFMYRNEAVEAKALREFIEGNS